MDQTQAAVMTSQQQLRGISLTSWFIIMQSRQRQYYKCNEEAYQNELVIMEY